MDHVLIHSTPVNPTQAGPAASSSRRQVVTTLLGAHSFEAIDWRALLQQGVLVRLRIRRCRFTARLTLDDLGIHIADEEIRRKLATWLVLGEKRLLPERYMRALSRIESSARYALRERAFWTVLGAFVPVTAYESWRTTAARLQGEYFALRDEILRLYPVLLRQVMDEYETIAREIYQRLPLPGTLPGQATDSAGFSFPSSQEAFVSAYCGRIQQQVPSLQRIEQSFAFEYMVLEGSAQLGEAGTPMPAQDPATESQEEATAASIAGQEYARQRAVMRQDLRTQAEARANALEDVLASLVGHLRTLIYEAVTDLLATLQRRGGTSFSPRSVVQLKHLMTQIRSLNFYGDQEVERIMEHLQAIVELRPAERQRSLPEIQQVLRSIAITTRQTLLDLEEEPRAPHEVEVPELLRVPAAAVRQARAELGLDRATLPSAGLYADELASRQQRAEAAAPGADHPETLWQEPPRAPRMSAS